MVLAQVTKTAASSGELWLAVATLVISIITGAVIMAVAVGRLVEGQRALGRTMDTLREDVRKIDERQDRVAERVAALEGAASSPNLKPHKGS